MVNAIRRELSIKIESGSDRLFSFQQNLRMKNLFAAGSSSNSILRLNLNKNAAKT